MSSDLRGRSGCRRLLSASISYHKGDAKCKLSIMLEMARRTSLKKTPNEKNKSILPVQDHFMLSGGLQLQVLLHESKTWRHGKAFFHSLIFWPKIFILWSWGEPLCWDAWHLIQDIVFRMFLVLNRNAKATVWAKDDQFTYEYCCQLPLPPTAGILLEDIRHTVCSLFFVPKVPKGWIFGCKEIHG